jgi:hypothetical protein
VGLSEGLEPRSVRAPTHDRSRLSEHAKSVGMLSQELCPSHRQWTWSHRTEGARNASRRQSEGPRQLRRGPSAAKDSIGAGGLHLASLQRGSIILREDCYNVVTRAPTVGNDSVVPDSKRERGVHARAMLFWVLAALAVVGALAIVWGLYLLARRWL